MLVRPRSYFRQTKSKNMGIQDHSKLLQYDDSLFLGILLVRLGVVGGLAVPTIPNHHPSFSP